MPDSRTLQHGTDRHPVYSTSFQAGEDDDVWIQGPTTKQPYEHLVKSYIKGIYVQIGEPVSIVPLIDPDTVSEFAAWEAASDEALLNFENNLD